MSVTLHTNLGDLKVEVFCESVPKTAEVISATVLSLSRQLTPLAELPRSLRIWIL
jgi:cyclophilin family peptidyl-prolyl cis-trans isomerase